MGTIWLANTTELLVLAAMLAVAAITTVTARHCMVACCSPTFNEMSNNQTVATWPAPGGINETHATATCRATIVNTSLIGQSCYDSIGNEQSATDIIEACVNDVQV